MVEENTQEIYFAHFSLDMDMCLNLIIYQDLEGRRQSKVTSLTKLFSLMILIFTILTFPEVGKLLIITYNKNKNNIVSLFVETNKLATLYSL